MDILTEVIDDEDIDDMFSEPQNYVDNSYDRPIFRFWGDGVELFTMLIGMNDNGAVYLVAEDEETSEYFYPKENDTLWDVYDRILSDWLDFDVPVPADKSPV